MRFILGLALRQNLIPLAFQPQISSDLSVDMYKEVDEKALDPDSITLDFFGIIP